MAEARVHRRLAAILAADVVGYSRLMGDDEAGTLARLKALRADLLDPKAAEYGGRIFKTTGDGILIEFPSAVDAVSHALDVQRAAAQRDADLPEDRRIALRIGINVGEVIVDGEDLYGDGVNVAARLEALAEPGGICLSGDAHRQVRGRIEAGFADLGAQALKNIAEPVQVWRVTASEATDAASASWAVLQRPAVAVLPFENLSGDPEQEFFADGLTEDIITALSLWRTFPVIARNSTYAFKGRSPDIREVGALLKARYVIEGSVRRGGDRLRVTVQLIDAETGHHVWAERYDRRVEDIFALQDEITTKVAATIEPEIARVESDRAGKRQTDSLAAWELYARGLALVYSRTKDGHLRARALLESATRLDPNFSKALAMLGMTYHRDLYQGSPVPREALRSTMTDVCTRAVKADPRDATAHHVLGNAYVWWGEHEKALAEGERAIALNPSEAAGYVTAGMALELAGKPDEALRYLENGARLNPHDPRSEIFETTVARAHFNAGRYEAAMAWASRALQTREDYDEARLILASSLGHLGRADEMASAIQLSRLGPPDYERIRILWSRYKQPTRSEHMFEGLRKAGLPEGG